MIYFLFFIALFICQLAYFRIADHFNIIDKPNKRSSHTQITLRGGGIIFYIGALLFFIISKFEYPWFFTGLTLISIISFADDVKIQSPMLRLVIQFVGLLLMFYQWQLFQFPWYFCVLAIILCIGIINAFNFMDGINGITGAYSLAVIGALWYINTNIVEFVDNQLIYVTIISLLVFNFFNFRTKAKCFAGDVGAISIAFIILFLLGSLIIKSHDFSYIILLAVYGVDTVLTIIHRMILRENIFDPHRKHVYQLMANELRIPHLIISTIYASIQVIIFIGLLIFKNHALYSIIVIIILSVTYLLFKKKYYYLVES